MGTPVVYGVNTPTLLQPVTEVTECGVQWVPALARTEVINWISRR